MKEKTEKEIIIERVKDILQPMIDDCLNRNGMPFCKNCGLGADVINKITGEKVDASQTDFDDDPMSALYG